MPGTVPVPKALEESSMLGGQGMKEGQEPSRTMKDTELTALLTG